MHGPGDGFDSEILIHQACRHDFIVREEAICYRLPIEDFLELTANNPAFAAYFLTGDQPQAGERWRSAARIRGSWAR